MGKAVFLEEKCHYCHQHLSSGDQETDDIEVMQKIFVKDLISEPGGRRHLFSALNTDPTMACNAVLHTASTGALKGFGEIGDVDNESTAKLLTVMARQVIISDWKVVAKNVLASIGRSIAYFFGFRSDSDKSRGERKGEFEYAEYRRNKEMQAQRCRDIAKGEVPILNNNGEATGETERVPKETQDLLRYKARPLNGIWATAPYMHNGSIPSLKYVLEPSDQRPNYFNVAPNKFDPDAVGFPETTIDNANFSVLAPDGQEMPGNSNQGHDYGVMLPPEKKLALLEYLKSL